MVGFRNKQEKPKLCVPISPCRAYVWGMKLKVTEADVRLALIQTEGNLSWTANRCAMTRRQLRMYIDTKPALQALLVDLQEGIDDEAESDLADGVFAGQPTAVMYCLLCASSVSSWSSCGEPDLPGPLLTSHALRSPWRAAPPAGRSGRLIPAS